MSKGFSKGGFAQRSGKGAGKSNGDAWRAYLAFKVGSGSQSDMEKRWLRQNGGSGETLADLWSSFLNAKGYTSGTMRERRRQYLETANLP